MTFSCITFFWEVKKIVFWIIQSKNYSIRKETFFKKFSFVFQQNKFNFTRLLFCARKNVKEKQFFKKCFFYCSKFPDFFNIFSSVDWNFVLLLFQFCIKQKKEKENLLNFPKYFLNLIIFIFKIPVICHNISGILPKNFFCFCKKKPAIL